MGIMPIEQQKQYVIEALMELRKEPAGVASADALQAALDAENVSGMEEALNTLMDALPYPCEDKLYDKFNQVNLWTVGLIHSYNERRM